MPSPSLRVRPCAPRARAARARATAPFRTALAAALLLAAAAPPLQAQRGDTARTAADSARRIERVTVTAIRAGDAAPIAQHTLERPAIRQRHFGQDVPLLLQGAAPSLIAHTETGTPWGYSYLRLRGVDQTRINITIDGVPLNDMEDQVLYFANFADLMGNVQSVQVQRGVGTSSAGTASFAGSINFETAPVALREPEVGGELQAGSFGSQRASLSFRTGRSGRGFAAYGRASALRTNGFRDHSGVLGRSAFLGAGWFGARDVVKLTALVGLLADTLSYVGATREQLARNRRFNPLSPEERDRFGQQMVALAWTRATGEATTLATTVYRNSASGTYDFFDGDDRYLLGLAHAWVGVTSALNHARGALRLNAGLNANTYARDHEAWLRPDLATSLYGNTGHKQDVSAFTKASLERGALTWFADLQARHARFRYEPDPRAGITERSIAWTFFNPKAGVTWAPAPGVSAFASVGVTSREPARNDLLAGEDDLNAGNVDALGDFTRVRPESVRDTELGVTLTRAAWRLDANLYSMDFTNDIARIGAPTASGAILRRNVGASYRRGLEVDGRWQATARLAVGGNLTWSRNRIREFTDSSRATPVVLRDVEPLLTPRLQTAHRTELALPGGLALQVEGRYQGRAFLDNTGSPDRVLPDFYVLDAAARWAHGRTALTVRGANLGDTQKYGSGTVSRSGTVRYFVLQPRSVFVTAEIRFGGAGGD
jgi:iron complex outermembrane receptor protein